MTTDDHGGTTDDGDLEEVLVVLVPGLGLDGRSWAAVRSALAGPSAVVTLPALGERAVRGTDLHVTAQAGRLVGLLPTDRRVVLVGHSAGCPVVVHAAALAPQVVGTVLVGPVTDLRARTWPRLVVRWLRTARHENLWEARVLLRQYLATGLFTMARGLDAVRRYRTDRTIATSSVPTVVVRGEHDAIASQRWCRALVDHAPGHGVVEDLAGGAHMVPLTHPHEVAAVVDRLRADLAAVAATPCATVDGT